MFMKREQMMTEATYHYLLIERAIEFLEKNFDQSPNLDLLAKHLNMSISHLERVFKQFAGITPMQFARYISVQKARPLLRQGQSMLDTALDVGLSGPGRLHDLFLNYEAMTPGEYKKLGDQMKITYGVHPTRFGDALIGLTEKGICHLSFLTYDETDPLQILPQYWPKAIFVQNQEMAKKWVDIIFEKQKNDKPLTLHLKGTNFQIKVWEALMRIPEGATLSYQDVAAEAGNSKAVRAAASAVANNPISYLIPCHRVIRKSGLIHNYRWGATRKKAILIYEQSTIDNP